MLAAMLERIAKRYLWKRGYVVLDQPWDGLVVGGYALAQREPLEDGAGATWTIQFPNPQHAILALNHSVVVSKPLIFSAASGSARQ